MATPKVLTANDIQQGKLIVITNGTSIHVERRYEFLDGVGQVIPEWAGNRIVKDVEFSSMPPDIQAALIVINNWTYQQALIQEGMN